MRPKSKTTARPKTSSRRAPAKIRSAPPAFVAPQLATLVDRAPTGDEWLHEIKFDGFRILARVVAGRATLFTRTGQDWSDRFAPVAAAAGRLKVRSALIDGEVAVLRPDGTTSFQALQNFLEGAGKDPLVYFAFDLLFLDGEDLRARPLEERKQILRGVLEKKPNAGAATTVRYTDHVLGNGQAFFEKARDAGLEGIISKKRREPYRTGRSPAWVKTKALRRQEFVVGGFTEPEGARAGIGALLVGNHRDGAALLSYSGKVGTGYTQKVAVDLRKRLDRLQVDRSPFDRPIASEGREIRWVKPAMVVEVAYAEITADGRLRHPSFQGLRDDKRAADVVPEVPAAAPRPMPAAHAPAAEPAGPRPAARHDAKHEVAGVKMTHPDRMLDESTDIRKRDLAAYYQLVAPLMLPHLVSRPVSLVRCPEGMAGKCFYMKHAAFSTPELRRITIAEKEEKGEYLMIDTPTGLVAVAQMSVIEIHTWNSVEQTLEQPDRVVFDFDPGPDVRWPDVLEGARLVRERVEAIGCKTFVKTTGGKGLHVVVPLRPNASWDECKTFTQLVSESVVNQDPKLFTTAMRKAGREDKILIDYFRNHRGSTSVAAYSPRTRPGLPVSLPLSWEQLADFTPDYPFTLASTMKLVAGRYRDPWDRYEASRVDLKDVILNARPPGGRAARGK